MSLRRGGRAVMRAVATAAAPSPRQLVDRSTAGTHWSPPLRHRWFTASTSAARSAEEALAPPSAESATGCATSPSSRTSTTVRPRSLTPSCPRAGRKLRSASWITTPSRRNEASPSAPSTPPPLALVHPQRRRHPRPRRFRRRGGARPRHGRRLPSPRGRHRGSHGADQVCPLQGASEGPPPHRRHEQGGSRRGHRRRMRRGGEQTLRPLRVHGRGRRTARFRHRLRLRARASPVSTSRTRAARAPRAAATCRLSSMSSSSASLPHPDLPEEPFRMLVSMIEHDAFVGRLVTGRVAAEGSRLAIGSRRCRSAATANANPVG